ncbi:helix-turn-helix transcriptional regulator [uncultured Mailhella sp.]|uniref:helix-turn-helix domain-containing protein n=1 Tax=uncultured Mailhella sp. TaxID=1981031 RepID=UPI0025FA2CDA|nr:helix-turn-helix transcriptional regulator [uncultured Mailhella sp.]
MDTVDLRFANALKKLRKAKGLTQEALAQRAGVDYKYLQKLEGRNPSSPTLATMKKLANGLEVTLVELVSRLESSD